MSKPEADPAKEGYDKCFGEFYTREETIDYMKEVHNEAEERVGTVFDSMMVKLEGTEYLEQAEKRAVERRRRRKKNEKKKMKNDRLQILTAKSLQLVKGLTRKEKDMLGFLVTKDFSNETSYIVEGIHEPSYNCHCFSCYYQKKH